MLTMDALKQEVYNCTNDKNCFTLISRCEISIFLRFPPCIVYQDKSVIKMHLYSCGNLSYSIYHSAAGNHWLEFKICQDNDRLCTTEVTQPSPFRRIERSKHFLFLALHGSEEPGLAAGLDYVCCVFNIIPKKPQICFNLFSEYISD